MVTKLNLKDWRMTLLVGAVVGALAAAPLGVHALDDSTTDNTGAGSQTTATPDTAKAIVAADDETPVDTTAPTVPAGLTATATGSTTVTLTWTASTDDTAVVGYNVYRDDALITNVTGTTYDDTGLTASTLYHYSVSAVDAAGNESDKATASITTLDAGTTTTTPPATTTTTTSVSDLQSAIAIAVAEHANVAVTSAKITTLQGNEVYKVTFSDGWVAYVDADNGSVLLLQNSKGQSQPRHNYARTAWILTHSSWNPWAAAYFSYSQSWLKKQSWQKQVQYSTSASTGAQQSTGSTATDTSTQAGTLQATTSTSAQTTSQSKQTTRKTTSSAPSYYGGYGQSALNSWKH